MTYEEFKALLPDSAVSSTAFPRLLMQAEAAINDAIVYCYDELSGKLKAVYNKALALQIDHGYMYGAVSDGLTSQTINGTSMTFSGGSAGSINMNGAALAMLRNAGLCARSGATICPC